MRPNPNAATGAAALGSAARAFFEEQAECLGYEPVIDEGEGVLREGYIVVPPANAFRAISAPAT